MRLIGICCFVLGFMVSCSSGTKKPVISEKDSLVKDSIVEDAPNKPIYMVKNNHMDWDSLKSFFLVNDFNGNLENLNVFSGIYDNKNYALIGFDGNRLVVGGDTLLMWDQQRIIGSFVTDSTDEKKIKYLIIYKSGDYGEQFDLISVDSTGRIIDFTSLMGSAGDGGDSYFSNIRRVKKYSYEVTYFQLHQNYNDTLVGNKEISSLEINLNGTFSTRVKAKKIDFTIIGEKNIQNFIDELDY